MSTVRQRLLRSIARGFIVTMVLGSLAGYRVSYLGSLHLHILPDGRIVLHSHPLQKDESKQHHTHTECEYQLIGAVAKCVDSAAPHSNAEFKLTLDGGQSCESPTSSPPPNSPSIQHTGRSPPRA